MSHVSMTLTDFNAAGMDAQVSYEFHSERKRNPEKFKKQITNQVFYVSLQTFLSYLSQIANPIFLKGAYAKLGLKQGWFAPSLTQSSSRYVEQW
jgi:diacylglycerol kinase (ATP)